MSLPKLIISGTGMEYPILIGNNLLVISVAYFVGCFSTGYYLVKFVGGKDIRQLGSGSTGAKNVGRILGKPGFVATLAGDIFKSVCIVLLAMHFGLRPWEVILTIIAVVTGHIFPFQLGFRGGKGLSVALGAMGVFDYQMIAIILTATTILSLMSRQLTLTLMVIIATAPVIGMVRGYSPLEVSGLVIISLLLIYAHRMNIKTSVLKIRAGLSDKNIGIHCKDR